MSGKIAQNPNRQSGAIGSIPSATKSASNPTITTNPSTGVGTEWINTTSGDIFLCTDATTNANWWINQRGDSVKAPGERALIAGGWNGAYSPDRVKTIEYVTISTTGNTTDFGDLTIGSGGAGGTSNGVNGRGLFYIEYYGNGGDGYSNAIDYLTIDTPADAADFGDAVAAAYNRGFVSNGTNERCVAAGGRTSGATNYNGIEYNTISTLGNGTTFGTLASGGRSYTFQSFSNGTNDRGVWSGGEMDGSQSNDETDYVTISTTGNSTDFGNLSPEQKSGSGCSNDTDERGLVIGGNEVVPGPVTTIQYFTINSTGNSTDFGELITARYGCTSASNGINERALTSGGAISGTLYGVIEYNTINSPGTAVDFGDMSYEAQNPGSLSNGAL